MTKRCYVCGDFIIEGEICTTCLNVLKLKYPNKRELESILQWHKINAELNQES